MTTLTMAVPYADAMAETPGAVLDNLLSTGTISKVRLLTFGFINTPIFRNIDRVTVAYVVYWCGGWITVCRGEGETLTLAGAERGTRPSQAQCLELFYKYCPEAKG